MCALFCKGKWGSWRIDRENERDEQVKVIEIDFGECVTANNMICVPKNAYVLAKVKIWNFNPSPHSIWYFLFL